jgi:hypothetical protein
VIHFRHGIEEEKQNEICREISGEGASAHRQTQNQRKVGQENASSKTSCFTTWGKAPD